MKTASRACRQYAGAVLWLLSIQYYAVQVAAAAAWGRANGYSWTRNTISDLANTRCGPYGNRLVCSPLHMVMNGSFIVLGLTMISGAFLLSKGLSAGRAASFGFGCMMLAGAGTIVVGLFPENTISWLHIAGAALPFALGNLGMAVLGVVIKKQPGWLRVYAIISGIIGLAATGLLINSAYLGLGIGGMERLAGYPQSIWMIIVGAYLLLSGLPAAAPD